ncbi:MAG: YkgJ family cysteine cluster protein [Crocinitomix sp.]|nr:YkgJ family cysteine cluster protein [Crocinitomix sp.]
MEEKLKQILENSKANEKENAAFIKRLKKQSKRDIDQSFHKEHDAIFQKIDCLDCGNCCSTTSPIFTQQDIKRLSKLFKMKPAQFIAEYLRVDLDDDYVLKSTPCPFLLEDNKCFVYDVRPQACSEYPHTNRKNMYQILDLTQKNTLVCPAVGHIVEHLRNIAPKKKYP